jgi:putative tryptophan/tyrosine transport system substrate-binding protein
MSYSADLYAVQRRSATFVDRILKGADPANLPVEQPTQVEFAVNMRTAKAVGITIPPTLLQRADRVIE